jgi:hypothetical protein
MVEGLPERDAPDQQQQPVLDGDEEEDIDQLLAAAKNSGPLRCVKRRPATSYVAYF